MWKLLFVLVSVLAIAVSTEESDRLVVTTTRGKVRGITVEAPTSSGKTVDAWYGIPYAQPPLGKLRFKPPVPHGEWEGVHETDKLPNSCYQISDTFFGDFMGSMRWNPNTNLGEDCLYLNVVVPNPRPENAAVMVWIHGGGFYSGTSTLDSYDLKTLVSEENVVAVSMQYRLASLGFLYLDDPEVPGNAGLLDQVMALRWVKENIALFGGDPNKVTLFGESAGAAAVSFHLLSNQSRELFHGAIMQSGVAIAPWAVLDKDESISRSLRLAELVECPHSRENISEMVECLENVDAWRLIGTEWNFQIQNYILQLSFGPVVDGLFLEDIPHFLMENKEFKKCPILLGSNQDEGNSFLLYYLADMMPKRENVFISRDMFIIAVKHLYPYLEKVAREALVFEYTDWFIPEDPVRLRDSLDKMVGDYEFTCPTNAFAQEYARAGENVYMYHFKHRSSVHYWPRWTGVMHADEISFVFGEPLNESKMYTKQEQELSQRMMKYWANFARTGNPNSINADRSWGPNHWPLHTQNGREYISITDTPSSLFGQALRARQCAFWDSYLPWLRAALRGEFPIGPPLVRMCPKTETVATSPTNSETFFSALIKIVNSIFF